MLYIYIKINRKAKAEPLEIRKAGRPHHIKNTARFLKGPEADERLKCGGGFELPWQVMDCDQTPVKKLAS